MCIRDRYGTGAMYFNGSNGYLTMPAKPYYDLSGGDFTVECWVYVTGTGNNTIFTLGTGGSATYWGFQVNSNNTLTFETNTAANWNWPNSYNSAAAVLSLNQWTHLAAVRYGSNFTMYANGTSVYTTNSFINPVGSTGTLYIGTYYNNYNNDGSYFRGYMDDVRITKGVARYTANFTAPTSALIPQ